MGRGTGRHENGSTGSSTLRKPKPRRRNANTGTGGGSEVHCSRMPRPPHWHVLKKNKIQNAQCWYDG